MRLLTRVFRPNSNREQNLNKICFVICASVFLLDRVSKLLAVALLRDEAPYSFLLGFLTLTYTENGGAMLGLGGSLPEHLRLIIFIVFVGAILVVGTLFTLTRINDIRTASMSMLIIGGGIANLYDRVFNNGYVIDYAVIRFSNVSTGVFNLADVAIMIGVFGLVFVGSNRAL